ncbi:MAG: PAS domain-containing sensor histidine kinase [Candidatus Marsarchaeota archaeon]|jgi:PAS domain S-box-containing protein|nr:PAS domain-containing sensor histidine kinase [Candidatus Marsarchaeota archaeon]
MVSEILLNKLINDIMTISSISSDEEEVKLQLGKAISAIFGLDKATFKTLNKDRREANSLNDYLINTKEPYVDNQLSEYSAFKELIEYKNQGYKSCAMIPITTNNDVVVILETLSQEENRFAPNVLEGLRISSFIVGSQLAYAVERKRNLRLANYFDAAFNSTDPQLLVSKNGSVVKANKAAMAIFRSSGMQGRNVNGIIPLKESMFVQNSKSTGMLILRSSKNQRKVYRVSYSAINENMIHVSAADMTNAMYLDDVMNSINKSRDICAITINGSLVIENITENFDKVFKCSKELVCGNSIIDFLDVKEREMFSGMAKEGGREFISGEMYMLLADERPFVHFVIVKSIEGYLMLLIKADMQKRVDDMEEGIEDFISGTSDTVLRVDTFGYIKGCNMSAEELLGYKKDEFIGRELKSIYSTMEILDRDISYARKGMKVNNSYINIIKKDGNPVPAIHSIYSLAGDGGEPDYMVIIRELETKAKLEEKDRMIENQANQIKKLSTASDLKSQFINNISHELKTPLTSIKGFTKLMHDGEFGELNNEQRGYLDTILEESDRLLLIIQQVLDASRLEANKVKLDMRGVDMKSLKDSPSIKALEEAARNKGLKFSWTVDYNVPEIVVDTNRLIQVFVNLIGNSIKFTEHGGIKIRVTRKSKKTVQVDVEDTGIGINDDDKRKIFKKFYEAPKKGLTKQDGAGTGLGLSITRSIINLHGGRISFDSQQGKGTRFYFTLPVSPKQKKKEPV